MSQPSRRPYEADLSYFVGGMDCANCKQRVETMVSQLAGVSDLRVNFSRQTLELHLDETQMPRELLENNLRALGYQPALQSHHTPVTKQAAQPEAAWYSTAQGRLVLLSGAALLLAWLLGLVAPSLAYYGYALATLLGVWPLLLKALAGLRLRAPLGIDALVTLAALGALAIGQAPEGAVVVFLFAVGELLEGYAAGRARAGIRALTALAPRTATLLEGDTTREVSAASLQVGQVVQVGAGARVPADGVIIQGRSSLDDSPVTGESMPVSKGEGERVYAGSINGGGLLRVQVDRPAHDNTMARIIRMVQEAEEHKAPTARLIEHFSRWYTPSVVAVAAVTAVLPPLLLAQPWHVWLYKGLALLLIGCPCALVLSVPAAVTSAVSAGTRHGLLIKGGAVLEELGRIRTVAFDKTGTLTAGRAQVTDIVAPDPIAALSYAAALETGSAHPLAQAICQEAAQRGLSVPVVSGVQAHAGRGVSGTIAGQEWHLSAPLHAPLNSVQAQQAAQLAEAGKTVSVLYSGSQVLALLALRDELRPEAAAALARLRRQGVGLAMLTGDNARTASALGASLGVAVHAELLPEDKLRIMDELAGPVAMVGDGINDAPALARAAVGIALGSGTDVALETAGAALLRPNLHGVADLLALSRAATSNIKQNMAFALGLKALFLVTTLLGITNLWMAVLADTGATALVTANALRLLRWRPHHDKT